MAVVGSAEVVIRALTTQLKADIKRGLDQAANDAEKSGNSAGDSWVKGFRDRVSANLGTSFDFDAVIGAAGDAGGQAGSAYSGGFNQGASDGDSTRGFQRRLRDTIPDASDVGGDAGKAFLGGFGGAMGSGGGGRRGGFMGGFFLKILAFLPIITTLIAALSSLVSGLFAVASAAAVAAAGGLALLPGIIMGIVAAIGVMMIAFKGIGGAFQELGKQQAEGAKTAIANGRANRNAARAVRDAGRAIEDAHERVRDANEALSDAIRNLARAREDAARGAVDAARRVEDAERDVQEAQERAREAQEGLTQAREDAAEKLEDLQLSLRGAVLSEAEATLRLQRARRQYQESMNRPGTSMDREQARIDLMQAELALDQARDRREDVTEQTQEANEAGIEGSEEVVRAKEEIDDANRNLADSERDLIRAREDQVRQAEDAAERISDAQEAVRDAHRAVAKAVQGVADAQERYADALQNQRDAAASAAEANAKLLEEFNKLSPAAQSLVTYMHSLRDEFSEIRRTVQEAMLPAVERFIRAMTTPQFMELWTEGLGGIARAIGRVFDTFTELFSDASAREDFMSFFRTSAELAEGFGNAFGTFGRAFLSLTAGAEPFLTLFAGWMENSAQSFLDWINRLREDGSLNEFFLLAMDAARAIGDAIGAIMGWITPLVAAATPAGIELLDMFTKALDAKAAFFSSDEGQAELKQFFEDVIPNVEAIMGMLGDLLAAFIRIGDNPAIADIATNIRENFIPALEKAIDNITTHLAPAIMDIFGRLLEFLAAMSESVVLRGFLQTIRVVIALFADLVKIPIVRELLAVFAVFATGALVANRVAGPVKKISGAFDTLRKTLGILGIAFPKFGKALGLIVRTFKLLKFAMLGNPFGIALVALTALVGGLIWAYNNFEGFRNLVKNVWDFIVGVFQWAYDKLVGNSIIPDLINGIVGWFQALLDLVGGIIGGVRDVIVGIWDGIRAAIQTVIEVITTIVTTYLNIWKTIIRVAFNVIKTVVTTVFNGIKTFVGKVFDGIRVIFERVTGFVSRIWNEFWERLKRGAERIFNAIKIAVEFIFERFKRAFEFYVGLIKRVWEGFWDGLRSVGERIFGGIKRGIDTFLDGIVGGFRTTVSTVRRVWDGFREAISKPIRTVVNVAYNKGIRGFWNTIAGVIGATKLKEIRFAKGGYVPGYAPGQDTVRALLSPGEGVLVPEAVRGIARSMGKHPRDAINALNAQYTNRVTGPRGGSGGIRFAGGGYVPFYMQKFQGGPLSWDAIKDFSEGLIDKATDWALGSMAKGAKIALDSIYKLLDSALPDNGVGELLGKMPRKIGDSILGFLRKKDEEAVEPSGSVGTGKIGDQQAGSHWRNLANIFRKSGLPGLITSTVRAPRFPKDKSWHVQGKAIDISANAHGNRGYGHKGLRDIFLYFAEKYGRTLQELILAGAPYNIKRGRKVGGYAWGRPGEPGNHWNHVHVAAMAQGGTVLPRMGGTLALLAEAGKPESVVDTGLLNQRLADLSNVRQSNDDVVRELRRMQGILETIGAMGGITIGKIEATGAPGEMAAQTVPRALRHLAFELGQ